MEERVRDLYQQNLICHEETSQIKTLYSPKLTKCIAEMLHPRYAFKSKSRTERVRCIKQLRVKIEERRGDLLLREIDRKFTSEASPISDETGPTEATTMLEITTPIEMSTASRGPTTTGILEVIEETTSTIEQTFTHINYLIHISAFHFTHIAKNTFKL